MACFLLCPIPFTIENRKFALRSRMDRSAQYISGLSLYHVTLVPAWSAFFFYGDTCRLRFYLWYTWRLVAPLNKETCPNTVTPYIQERRLQTFGVKNEGWKAGRRQMSNTSFLLICTINKYIVQKERGKRNSLAGN